MLLNKNQKLKMYTKKLVGPTVFNDYYMNPTF